MIDCILYIPSMTTLIQWFAENRPEALSEDGTKIIGLDRTPAVQNGDAVLVYARLRDTDIEVWNDTPHTEVLSKHKFEGKGTSDKVYETIFNNEALNKKYKSVYDCSQRKVYDEYLGETIQVTPPRKFGMLAE